MKIASLCILAYERPLMLREMVDSLEKTEAGYPYELIIHNDGSKDKTVSHYINFLVREGLASFVVENGGRNMGLAHAMRHCIGCSHGDYIFKLDSDLTFRDNWLKKSIDILQDKEIGAVGLLDYRNYDPDDKRFHNLTDKGNYWEADNFVSSAYGFRREIYEKHGYVMGNDGWHMHLYRNGYKLAITNPDVVDNHGFGKNSIYVGEDGKAVTMHDEPLIFEK